MKRSTNRHRRFQLSMQAFVCHRWLLTDGRMVFGLRREIMLEYSHLAGWRSGVFRV
jgi:hypothetical protein